MVKSSPAVRCSKYNTYRPVRLNLLRCNKLSRRKCCAVPSTGCLLQEYPWRGWERSVYPYVNMRPVAKEGQSIHVDFVNRFIFGALQQKCIYFVHQSKLRPARRLSRTPHTAPRRIRTGCCSECFNALRISFRNINNE